MSRLSAHSGGDNWPDYRRSNQESSLSLAGRFCAIQLVQYIEKCTELQELFFRDVSNEALLIMLRTLQKKGPKLQRLSIISRGSLNLSGGSYLTPPQQAWAPDMRKTWLSGLDLHDAQYWLHGLCHLDHVTLSLEERNKTSQTIQALKSILEDLRNNKDLRHINLSFDLGLDMHFGIDFDFGSLGPHWVEECVREIGGPVVSKSWLLSLSQCSALRCLKIEGAGPTDLDDDSLVKLALDHPMLETLALDSDAINVTIASLPALSRHLPHLRNLAINTFYDLETLGTSEAPLFPRLYFFRLGVAPRRLSNKYASAEPGLRWIEALRHHFPVMYIVSVWKDYEPMMLPLRASPRAFGRALFPYFRSELKDLPDTQDSLHGFSDGWSDVDDEDFDDEEDDFDGAEYWNEDNELSEESDDEMEDDDNPW